MSSDIEKISSSRIKAMPECELIYRLKTYLSVIQPVHTPHWDLFMELRQRFGKDYWTMKREEIDNALIEYHLLYKRNDNE